MGRAQSAPPVEPDPEPYEAIALEANDMLEEITLDATAEVAPEGPAPIAPPGPAVGAPRDSEVRPAVQAWEPLAADAAIAAIEAAGDRVKVADALLGHAAALFDVGALFIARDNLAFGWKAFGAGVDPSRVECAVMPLELPSIFQQAAAGDGLYAGPPTPSALLNHWYKVLRCREPAHATVAAVVIRKRVVNVLYGHCAGTGEDNTPTAVELDDLRRVTDAAAKAYVRLIAGAKSR
jgi:hypothetical protein